MEKGYEFLPIRSMSRLVGGNKTADLAPAYSPDLNPIEQAFAKLKALLRKAAARSKEALWQAIAEAIDQFDPTECRNFFLNQTQRRNTQIQTTARHAHLATDPETTFA